MRKLAFAGALAAAALFAQGVRADDAAEKTKQAGQEAAGEAKKSATKAEEAGDRALHGTGPAQPGERGSTGMQASSDKPEKKHPLFEGKNNFDLEGKIQKVSSSSITIARQELPAAELKVSSNTKIELDGDKVSAQMLKPGQDVKASFNLNKDKAEAVEIKAEKTDAQKAAK